jgi:hypothetical protein
MQRVKTKPPTSFQRDRRRVIITCAGLFAMLAVAIVLGGHHAAKTAGPSGANPKGETASAGERHAGSVLFVPVQGNVCRKRVIDNATWRLRDDGYVTCDEAVTWNSEAQNQKYSVTERVDQIRAGFKAINQGKTP